MAKVVSFSLNKEAVNLLSELEKKLGFKNRSELVRSGLQGLLHEFKDLSNLAEKVEAIIAVVHSQDHESEVSELTHEFAGVISTQVHQNLKERCLDLFVVQGSKTTVTEFFLSLKKNKGVLYVKLIPLTP